MSVNKKFNNIILNGDLNIDWLTNNRNRLLLQDIMDTSDLKYSLPAEPTREFNDSRTAVDYVLSNVYLKLENLDLDICDHKLQNFSVRICDQSNENKVSPIYIWKKSYSNANLLDVNNAWNYCWQSFKFCVEKTCPLSKTKLYPFNNAENWVDAMLWLKVKFEKPYWLSKNESLSDTYKNPKKVTQQ